jgi:hypothetical protein
MKKNMGNLNSKSEIFLSKTLDIQELIIVI